MIRPWSHKRLQNFYSRSGPVNYVDVLQHQLLWIQALKCTLSAFRGVVPRSWLSLRAFENIAVTRIGWEKCNYDKVWSRQDNHDGMWIKKDEVQGMYGRIRTVWIQKTSHLRRVTGIWVPIVPQTSSNEDPGSEDMLWERVCTDVVGEEGGEIGYYKKYFRSADQCRLIFIHFLQIRLVWLGVGIARSYTTREEGHVCMSAATWKLGYTLEYKSYKCEKSGQASQEGF